MAVRECFEKRLTADERAVFRGPAGSQAYFIESRPKPQPQVLVGATGERGLRYAKATLQQLRSISPDGRKLPVVRIVDWPDFEYRLNNWLLWSEIGCWSYDRGDGRDAFVRRAKDKLRWSADHKINAILIDGFGWNAERFPGYGAMMRELNAFARELGIHLMYSGYGSGYGMGRAYGGKTFENRQRYPNGRRYSCCGHPDRGGEQSRYLGTCLSNDALLRGKQRELRRFVRNVHPGALYIHNIDLDDFDSLQRSWLLRCPRCRERWPSDDALSPEGAAGAYAHQYDQLTQAVFDVADSKTGYRAERDCLVVHVSPGYGDRSCSDKEWDNLLEYHSTVSRGMRPSPNILFGMREQFTRRRGARLRFQEMSHALKREGRGHGICGVIFGGCDAFTNDHVFNAAPSLSGLYRGAKMLMNCAGNAYQEPLQLLNAEYAWNASQAELPRSYSACIRRFEACKERRERPQRIFGPNGFLGRACRRLYGTSAGLHVRKAYTLATRDGLPALWHATTKSYEWLGNPSAQAFLNAWWGDDLPASDARERQRRWRRIAKVTREAHAHLVAASRVGPLPRSRADVRRLAKGLEIGAMLAEASEKYFAMYGLAQEIVGKGCAADGRGVKQKRDEILRLVLKIERLLSRQFPRPMLDYLEGDLWQTRQVLKILGEQSEQICRGVGTGERGEKSRRSWW